MALKDAFVHFLTRRECWKANFSGGGGFLQKTHSFQMERISSNQTLPLLPRAVRLQHLKNAKIQEILSIRKIFQFRNPPSGNHETKSLCPFFCHNEFTTQAFRILSNIQTTKEFVAPTSTITYCASARRACFSRMFKVSLLQNSQQNTVQVFQNLYFGQENFIKTYK